MAENISLVKRHQSKFERKAKKIKQKLEESPEMKPSQINKLSPSKQKFLQRGIIYVGHIPHGFYEEQMRKYFKQFGRVRNVIVCKSKKTNKSKGFGFIQFDNQEVAKIAAETMNNYLMFKRKLIAKYIPPEEVKPNMLRPTFWKTDAHKKFKTNREIQIKKKNSNTGDEKLFVNRSLSKLNKKKQLLAELGIEYNLPVDGPKEIVLKVKQSVAAEKTKPSKAATQKSKPVAAEKPTKPAKKEKPSPKKEKPSPQKEEKPVKTKPAAMKKSVPAQKTNVKPKLEVELTVKATATATKKMPQKSVKTKSLQKESVAKKAGLSAGLKMTMKAKAKKRPVK